MMKKVLLIGGNGYIGSRVHIRLKNDGHAVDVCDINSSPDKILSKDHKYKSEMHKLSRRQIEPYENIINLAAHSSVPQAMQNPEGAIYNNIQGLQHLLSNIDGQTLIYASSGSVYNGSGAYESAESDQLAPSRNIYDLTKSAGDQLVTLTEKNWIGLRFATVNGVSPKMRNELLVNKMVKDSVEHGVLNLANPHAFRGILAMDDLVDSISLLVNQSKVETGIFNLSSFNYSIGDIALMVSDLLGSSINNLEPSPTYNFSMSSAKFISTFNFSFSCSFETLVFQLKDYYNK